MTVDGAPARGPLDTALRDALAERARGPFDDVAGFVRALGDAGEAPRAPVLRAAWAGARADRLGFAFVGGYFAALAAQLGDAGGERSTCLAATEVGGVHPRAIEATLAARPGVGLSLRGEKTFVTLATIAEQAIVVARTDAGDGPRRALVAVRIPLSRAGVRVEERPATPFAPEVPHARVLLEDVEVSPEEVLPGDGWDDWLKPFRTAEDVHVLAATVGYLLAFARAAGVAEPVAPPLGATLAALSTIAPDGRDSAGAHVALEGAFALARGAFERLVATQVPEALEKERLRLERDAPLLAVAEGARQKRLALALARTGARAG